MEKEIETRVANTKYAIGLDIGTNSVGWAITDMHGNLLKKGGKNTWGVVLFDTAQTAQGRRLSRSLRRRKNRRKWRIEHLQNILAPMVNETDPAFLYKLKELSFLSQEDRGSRFPLFTDSDEFTDQDVHKKYPTIYHLRDAAANNDEKLDPRLIYLAIHHIVKYRGNFLLDGDLSDGTLTLVSALDQIWEALEKQIRQPLEADTESVKDLLLDFTITKKDKVKNALSYFGNTEKSVQLSISEALKAITGLKTNLIKLFGIENTMEEIDKSLYEIKLDQDFDSLLPQLEEVYNEELISLLETIKSAYDLIILKKLLGSTDDDPKKMEISKGKIKSYELHKKQLKEFKTFIKKYFSKEEFDNIFREGINKNSSGAKNGKEKVSSYTAYSKTGTCTQEDFYKYIKGLLEKRKDLENDPVYQQILKDIETESFLPKQTVKDNGTIPYQIHLLELNKIIKNQGKYYPILLENKEKLNSIMTFRVPYYVGPLNSQSPFGWAVRKEEGVITPWNLEEKIDIEKSAECFISNLTNYCTYLTGEKVLPRHSLNYEMYTVLDELNKVKVNGKYLEQDAKEQVITDCFKKKLKVTEKDLKKCLLKNQLVQSVKSVEGLHDEDGFLAAMEAWRFYEGIFGKVDESNKEMIEKLILWQTVYEDRHILRKRIKAEYPNLTDDKVNKIAGKRFKGWGRFSNKLLTGIYCQIPKLGYVSILDILQLTNDNFMQIINNKKYGFNDTITSMNESKQTKRFSHELVEDLPGSPAIKKGIWQSLKLVKELTDFMGTIPEAIFVEMAREDDSKNKRTVKREDKIKNLYKEILKNNSSFKDSQVYQDFCAQKRLKEISNEKVYLYYLQEGKCMYTGKQLDIDNLQLYQVDHIIPQSVTEKQNDLENKVLVISKENQRKANGLQLDQNIINTRKSFWEKLKKQGLMGEKKYRNLVYGVSEESLTGFINRQLVETRQISKHVIQILASQYPDTDVVAIKAGLSSNFRQKFELPKSRLLNNYHHAQDAFLSAQIGTVLIRAFPEMQPELIYKEYKKYKQKAKYGKEKGKQGIVINLFDKALEDNRTGEIIWDPSEDVARIRKYWAYKDCHIVKITDEGSGAFYDKTIYGPEKFSKKDSIGYPINKHRADIHKYGGYSSQKSAYGMLVSHTRKKNKNILSMIIIPVIFKNKKREEILEWLEVDQGLKKPVIVKEKVKLNQLIEWKGGKYYLSSPQELANANELVFDLETQRLFHFIEHNQLNVLYQNEEYWNGVADLFYETLLTKLETSYPLYKGKSILKTLNEQKENFVKLPFEKKLSVLPSLIKSVTAKSGNPKIKESDFAVPERIGRIKGFPGSWEDVVFVNYSISGLRCRKERI